MTDLRPSQLMLLPQLVGRRVLPTAHGWLVQREGGAEPIALTDATVQAMRSGGFLCVVESIGERVTELRISQAGIDALRLVDRGQIGYTVGSESQLNRTAAEVRQHQRRPITAHNEGTP